ncbi:MAG TPA: hypothetical protein DEG44_01170 [Candidatus Kerfeldbacteria bacterium]|nr:hypothetical protein [Candidatus Kerfeldbacteria bacterium]
MGGRKPSMVKFANLSYSAFMNRGLVLGVSLLGIGSLLATGLRYSGVAFGYGYGYGTCTADRPNGLTAEYVNNDKRIEFNWNAVEFSDCDDTTAASYRLQVRKSDATLLQDYSDITSTTKKISASSLLTNHAYKFRVRGIAVDDENTEWSLYKSLRTLPKKPAKLKVTQFSSTSAYISWRNIVRSNKLRYYQLVVKRGDKVVYSKRVKLGLRKNRTGTLVENLRPDVRYRVKVRAVARKTSKGSYAKRYFTLE